MHFGMKPSKNDPSLFMCFRNNKLEGILCAHVDDFLYGGSHEFYKTVIDPLRKTFTIGSEFNDSFKYLGLNLKQTKGGIWLDQTLYTNTLVEVELEKERKEEKDSKLNMLELKNLRSVIGQLGWLAGQTRPDISFDICDLSSKVKNATVRDLLYANKVIRKVKSENVTLRFGSIDFYECKIIGYCYASLVKLVNGGSQGGFVIFLTDKNGQYFPIMWQSKKLRRVVKSAMAAETLILVDCAEACFWIRKLINEIIFENSDDKNLPEIECNTDSHQLYDAVHSIKPVTDKRLRIDIAIIREMLENKDLNKFNWDHGSEQLADLLTKSGISSWKLLQGLCTNEALKNVLWHEYKNLWFFKNVDLDVYMYKYLKLT